MQELVEELKDYDSEDIYVLGGSETINKLWGYLDKVYVTKLDLDCLTDKKFPNLDRLNAWELKEASPRMCGDLAFSFCVYEQKAS